MKIQSISDLITNSSTEVFMTYNSETAEDIKKLVTSILSLVDPSKTFDDYFTIEMNINYDDLEYILDNMLNKIEIYSETYPWLKDYANCDDNQKFMESLSIETIEDIFDLYNNNIYDGFRYMYNGYTVTSKIDNPEVKRVVNILNIIDNFFGVDYINCW